MRATWGILAQRMNFSELGICPEILEAIEVLGFETPSAIQEAAIPPALAGSDVVGLSHTGSGKTLAFTIPALEHIDPSVQQVQVLCLAPTRELAVQISGEANKLALFLDGISATPIYGGTSFGPQLAALRRGVPFVAGTPGRVLDLMEQGELKADHISVLILDEADEMLDMGFAEDIERVVAQLPEKRQTLFFSATMSAAIRSLVSRLSDNPVEISIDRPVLTVPTCEQYVYEVLFSSRIEVLSRLIEMGRMKRGLVFANTKRVVDDVVDGLLSRGYSVDRLHGDMPQSLRERVMDSYRKGNLSVLVATDIAARGLDIDDVDVVVNFELPRDPEDYVHRIGRTARAGRKGKAVTFIGRRDFSLLGRIERFIGTRMQRERVMTADMVARARQESLVDDILELATKSDGRMPEELCDIELSEQQLIAAMFALLTARGSRELQPIPEDRPTRREMPERATAGTTASADDKRQETTTLFLNAGRLLHVRPKDIAGLLYNEGGAPKGSIGDIRIFLKHSLVEVSPDVAPMLIERLSTCSLCGYEVNVREDNAPEMSMPGEKSYHRARTPYSPAKPREPRRDNYHAEGYRAEGRNAGARRKTADYPARPPRERDRYRAKPHDAGRDHKPFYSRFNKRANRG